jgi:hypothetical protein
VHHRASELLDQAVEIEEIEEIDAHAGEIDEQEGEVKMLATGFAEVYDTSDHENKMAVLRTIAEEALTLEAILRARGAGPDGR